MHPTKKPWAKPEIRQLNTPEELLAFYHEGLSEADYQKLVSLAEQLERSARRRAGSLPLPKAATG
jgi:hypothetical protein